jgi:hypothetical protein
MMIYAAIFDCWSPEPWYFFIILNISNGVCAFTYNYGHIAGVTISIICQFINLVVNQLLWIDLGYLSMNTLVGTVMGSLFRNFVAFM